MLIAAIWTPSPAVPVRERPPKPERVVVSSPELETLRSALDAIPNDTDSLDYDQWRNVGFAIHYATEGSDEGLSLFHEFSARSGKYDPDFLDNRFWRYAGITSAEPITERSLFALASQHGWQDPTIVDDFDVVEGTETADDDFDALPASEDDKGLRFMPVPAHEFAVATQLRWIIKGILPQAELGVLYGESGSGKSFMALDMAASIARGIEWRGCKVRHGKIVYIAAEGANGFRNRLRAYALQHQVDLKDLPIHVIHAAPNMLDKTDALDVAKAILKVVGKCDLIIVDTLAQTMPGGNENAGEDMGKALAHCRGLHRATGAMVLLVHHSGKDSSKGARGWSGLRAAADVELEVVRSDEDRALNVTKQKDGDDGGEFGFKLETVLVDFDADGDEITSCVVEHCDSAVGSRGSKVAPKGKNEISIHKIVLDLTDVGEAPTVDQVLSEYANRTPYDPQGGRDTRRQHAMRALRSLIDKGVFAADGTRVKVPGVEEE
ncbi:AAA family ATPase [Propionivibrio dicarboxylicus]|uniref:Primase C terminal 2 (PriCT-2) n=1 Tax=Propionivibrio dicarboxylicus TaxID=83767 RepID=A0A1G8AT80_9RHOO|nr:AAA family ATPase [Propionivibrio dicarboxylicus]SDH23520.1 Primase C terminal 2 (PriCT-2) [Propionivibrio dicarboxylicus]